MFCTQYLKGLGCKTRLKSRLLALLKKACVHGLVVATLGGRGLGGRGLGGWHGLGGVAAKPSRRRRSVCSKQRTNVQQEGGAPAGPARGQAVHGVRVRVGTAPFQFPLLWRFLF